MTTQANPHAVVAQQSLVLYRRALHPGLFELRGRRSLTSGAYEAEVWVMPRGHMARFRHNGLCVCELVADYERLPEQGVVATFPCLGEHDFEHAFDQSVKYALSFQTENLSGTLFNATYAELKEFGRESGALIHEWVGNGDGRVGRGMSIVDVQRFAKEVHVQGFHLMSEGGLVLRTQALFEHR